MLALSATLSETSQHYCNTSFNEKFKTVLSVPTKDNITLTVLPRPPVGKNLSVRNSYDFVFESVFYDLKQKGQVAMFVKPHLLTHQYIYLRELRKSQSFARQ